MENTKFSGLSEEQAKVYVRMTGLLVELSELYVDIQDKLDSDTLNEEDRQYLTHTKLVLREALKGGML